MDRPHLRLLTRAAAALVAGALLGPLPMLASTTPAHAVPASRAPGGLALKSGWQPRPVRYPATVTRRDLAIPMSDGTVLRGDLQLPARADGRAVNRRFPVIVTITAYNKSSDATGSGL